MGKVNPFIPPPGLEGSVYVNHLVDVIGDAYTLGDAARSILQRAITACYRRGNHAPTASDVLKEIENIPDKERVRGWKISARRALESIDASGLTSGDAATQRGLAEILLKQNTVIELDALSQGSRKFLIPLLCLWLYYAKLNTAEREKLSLVLFIEEAHHVLYRQEQRSKETLMNMLLRQCRELGIGFVVVDQHPHLISSAALGNTYTSICLNQKDPSDINRAAGLSLLDEHDKKHLSMLPVGQGIVKMQDRWRRPFLVQFPLVQIKKGLVSDKLLSSLLTGGAKLSEVRHALRKELRQEDQSGTGDRFLTEDEFRFLHDVLQNENDGVDARYKRLEMSVKRGQAVRNALVERGWLSETTVKLGRTRKVILRVTREKERQLGHDVKSISASSVIHEYWKRYYANVFQERGYVTMLEVPRRGGRVDVLAVNLKERFGIEVETGKSDAVSNVRLGLLSRFDRVLVVATDDAAMHKVERQLAKAGLLLPDKVELVLRNGIGCGLSGRA